MLGWSDLDKELDAWSESGLTATFWWRDDDAVEPSPRLDRLLRLADDSGPYPLQIALAVIPLRAGAPLARRLRATANVSALQHGFAHANHEPADAKKSEFGPHRSEATVIEEMRSGWMRLFSLFGDLALPVLVPPWNRIDSRHLPALQATGLGALSRYGPRGPIGVDLDIAQVNTHIDVVDWARRHTFIGLSAALRLAIGHLSARRRTAADTDEPTGLLTHHLVQNDDAWAFVAEFLARTRAHPAVRWVGAGESFGIQSHPRPNARAYA